LLVGVAGTVFGFSVVLRRPWFGTVGEPYSAFFVTWPLLFLKDWYREGLWAMKGALATNPPSIEFPTLLSRNVPLSTPPGTLIPLHFIGQLVGHEPTIAWLMVYNLVNQLAIALILALMTYLFLRQIACSRKDAGVLALVPVLLYVLLPSPLYNHQMRFWGDHAIILYFVLYIFLETLRSAVPSRHRWIGLIQAVIVFMGIFTDWFFGVLVPCVYIKRFVAGEMGRDIRSWFWKSVAFWTPFALGLLLFGLQLGYFGNFRYVFSRIQAWTNPSQNDFMSIVPKSQFWTLHMVNGFGWTGIVLLGGVTTFSLALIVWGGWQRIHKRPLNPAWAKAIPLLFLLLGPSFLYLLILPRHAACPTHYFTTLKYGVALAVGPLVLAPVVALAGFGLTPSRFSWVRLCGRDTEDTKPGISLLSILLLAIAVGYIGLEWPRVKPQFTEGVARDINYSDIGEFLRANTSYEDVVFVFSRDIENYVSVFLPFSMKTVHNGRSLYRIYDKVRDIQDPYVINILRLLDEAPPPGTELALLLSLSRDHRTWKDLQLDKIPKDMFLALCQRVNPQPPPAIPEDEMKRIMEEWVRRAAEKEKMK